MLCLQIELHDSADYINADRHKPYYLIRIAITIQQNIVCSKGKQGERLTNTVKRHLHTVFFQMKTCHIYTTFPICILISTYTPRNGIDIFNTSYAFFLVLK